MNRKNLDLKKKRKIIFKNLSPNWIKWDVRTYWKIVFLILITLTAIIKFFIYLFWIWLSLSVCSLRCVMFRFLFILSILLIHYFHVEFFFYFVRSQNGYFWWSEGSKEHWIIVAKFKVLVSLVVFVLTFTWSGYYTTRACKLDT